MISIRNSLIVFVIGTVGIGLSILPAVAYGQTSSNSSAVMNTTSTIPLLKRFSAFTQPLTIAPDPVKAGSKFSVSGKLYDLGTGVGICRAAIDFTAVETWNVGIVIHFGMIHIPSVTTSCVVLPTGLDLRGHFVSSASALPGHAGNIHVVAMFSGNTNYYGALPSFGDVPVN
jgi:hypothetical protein